MKGISHFAIGVATASCFPAAITAAENGNPLYFILGGAFGLLPDTIDFKLYRFFYRHHAEVTPDPLNPDPQQIADAIVEAIEHAAADGKPFRIRLNTIRLGADLWQRYTLKFNLIDKCVEVEIGPKVDTGGTPVESMPQNPATAKSVLNTVIKLDYTATTNIDIFEGPIFQMTPGKDGCIVPQFIPWHRQWSHSFLVGIMFAMPVWMIWDALAAFTVIAAYSAHVAVDQFGYMGSSLFWPLTRRRTQGMKLQHSSEAFPNFSAVWLSCLLIFWNLARSIPPSTVTINPNTITIWAAIIPFIAIKIIRFYLK